MINSCPETYWQDLEPTDKPDTQQTTPSTETKIAKTITRTRRSGKRCSIKKGAMQISQNLHENTCTRASFLKLP